MGDEIKFDFVKAKSLSNTINECKRCIDNAKNTLEKEMDNVGLWWTGESYDRYRDFFDGPGGVRAFLDGLSEEAVKAGNFLVEISDSKRDFERDSSKYFK